MQGPTFFSYGYLSPIPIFNYSDSFLIIDLHTRGKTTTVLAEVTRERGEQENMVKSHCHLIYWKIPTNIFENILLEGFTML